GDGDLPVAARPRRARRRSAKGRRSAGLGAANGEGKEERQAEAGERLDDAGGDEGVPHGGHGAALSAGVPSVTQDVCPAGRAAGVRDGGRFGPADPGAGRPAAWFAEETMSTEPDRKPQMSDGVRFYAIVALLALLAATLPLLVRGLELWAL